VRRNDRCNEAFAVTLDADARNPAHDSKITPDHTLDPIWAKNQGSQKHRGRMKSITGQRIEMDGSHVNIIGKDSTWRRGCRSTFDLNAVSRIDALQADLFTVDMVTLAIEADGGYHEVFEDAEGYDALLGALEERYGRFPHDWHQQVTRTAFEENRTTLWAGA